MRNRNEPFEALLANLVNPETPLRATLIYRLSEPSNDEMTSFQTIWPSVPEEKKRLLLARLAETSEASFDVDFSDVALFALQDDDPEVRQHAIEALWPNENPSVMRRFITLLQTDSDSVVRAAAAAALGQFVLLGELEELAPAIAREAEEALLQVCLQSNEGLDVYRRALESLSFSGRKEVISLIEQASRHENLKIQASALFAMGRNSDQRWAPYVDKALGDPEPEIRFEAARAAGEMGLVAAVPRLIQFAHSDDRELQEVAIWALGEIGGAEAQNALFELAERETDKDLLESIEDALNMAALSMGDFGMFVAARDDNEDVFEDLENLGDDQDL